MDAEDKFNATIRRFAQSASALRAFDAGELDTVVDPSTGSVVLLAENPGSIRHSRAERAVHQLNRDARASLNLIATYICVLDWAGTVIMTNRAWRTVGAANDGTGLGVSEGANYLAACDNARGEGRSEGLAIAAGIRKVIAGEYELFRHESIRVTPAGRRTLSFTVTGFPGEGAVSVVVSRGGAVGGAHAHQRPALTPAPSVNRLLSALPRNAYKRLLTAGLEPVILRGGDVLVVPGQLMSHVYFPIESVVSLLMPIPRHPSPEVGLVGREGLVGLSVGLGIKASAILVKIQSGGSAMRMVSADFLRELREIASLQRDVSQFLHELMAQVMQTSACQHFHVLEQRLARMLLMTQDRTFSDELHLTQEDLAYMLGVQRPGVTLAAGALQKAQIIAYRRGSIKILDRAGLRAAACSCYVPLEHG